MNQRIAGRCFLAVLVFTMLICPVYAGVPQIINYEGTLTDTSGNPVPDGTYEIQFGIYNAQSGGTPIWTERWDSTTTPVAVYKGKFNVLLGTHKAIAANFFDSLPAAYIGVKVGTDEEMIPRQRLASVSYAFTSGYASTAAQASTAIYATSAGSASTAMGVVPAYGIIMWCGSAANIPAGWALCDGQNGTPDLRDRFIVGAGGSYPVGDQRGSKTANIPGHTHWTGDHVLSIAEMPYHNHNNGGYAYLLQVTGINTNSDTDKSANEPDIKTTAMMQPAGGNAPHNHGNTSEAGWASVETLPPYYALCFIMKKP